MGVPWVEVVDGAFVERDVAPGDEAGGVDHSQRPSLVGCGEPGAAAHVEHHTVSTEHDGDDVGVAGHTADRLDPQVDSTGDVDNRVVVDLVAQGFVVDDDDHLRPPR